MEKRRYKNKIILLLFFAVVLYGIFGIPNIMKALYPLYFEEHIAQYTAEYNIDPPLLASVIKAESNFNPGAESKRGARGLMQITPSTGQWIAKQLDMKNYTDDMLFDPETNIRFGCWYISYLYEHYDCNIDLIFAAYNGGLGNVDKWLKDSSLSSDGKSLNEIPFSETENYVKKIKKNYRVYKKLYKWNNE